MTEFDPGLTARLATKAKARLVWNWKDRLRDYSSVLAQIGVAVQGVLLALPVGTVSVNTQAWIAAGFFAAIQLAKIITEPSK